MRLAWILFLAFLVLVACVVGSSNSNIEGATDKKTIESQNTATKVATKVATKAKSILRRASSTGASMNSSNPKPK